MARDDFPGALGLSEEEAWDALEKLYREEKVDHVPGIGSDVDPAFELTDKGVESAKELLREDDSMVLYLLGLTVADNATSERSVAEALVDMGEHLRDDVGVNCFRVLERHDEDFPWVDASDFPDGFVEGFDP